MKSILLGTWVLFLFASAAQGTPIFYDDSPIEQGGDVVFNPQGQGGGQPPTLYPPGTVQELANGARYFLFNDKAFPDFDMGTPLNGWNLIKLPGASEHLPNAIAIPRPTVTSVPKPSTFTDQSQFVGATGARVVPIPASATAFPGTTCGTGDIGPTGIGPKVEIPFDTNELTVIAAADHDLCIFDGGTTIKPFGNTIPDVMTANTIVGNGEDDFTFAFARPVHAVGFRLLTNFCAQELVTLRDETGNTISVENIGALTPPNTRQFVGFKSVTPIKSVLLDTCEGAAQNEGIDEIKVAEPWQVLSAQDSFLRHRRKNINEGANRVLVLRKRGSNRTVVGFALPGVKPADVVKATLILTVAEPTTNWGRRGRLVTAHRLIEPFTEGNGKVFRLPFADRDRGNGPGVTWKCSTDAEVSNRKPNCEKWWKGGSDFIEVATDSVLHTNGMAGEVQWDVTVDVLNALQDGATEIQWLIKKDRERRRGKVVYYSREGAADVNNPSLAPRLLLDFQD